MKQGVVTEQTNAAIPVLTEQPITAESKTTIEPAPVENAKNEEPVQAAAPASDFVKTTGSVVESQHQIVTKGKETQATNQASSKETHAARENTNKQEITITKESAPKPDTVAASTSAAVESSRQSIMTSEPTLRPETPGATLAQQIHEGVQATIRQGKSSLRIQLSPQDLGAIDIRLVSSPAGVSMTVIAEQASTGRLLETQINQLRQTLADAGVQLSNLNISQHNQSNQMNQGSNSQSNQQPNANRFRRFDNQAQDELGVISQNIRPAQGIDYRV
jgi:flagellar hook-length control protein FliK